jgi:hypothetical protein
MIHGRDGVWLVRREGTHLRRIVCGCRAEVDGDVDEDEDELPAWSARGGTAFVGTQPDAPADSAVIAIYVVRPAGHGLRQITKPTPKPLGGGLGSFVQDTGPAWSLDGRARRRQRRGRASRRQRSVARAAKPPGHRHVGHMVARRLEHRLHHRRRHRPRDPRDRRSWTHHPRHGRWGFLVDLDWRTP